MKQAQWITLLSVLSYYNPPITHSNNPKNLATENPKAKEKVQKYLDSMILINYTKIKDGFLASDNEKITLLAKIFLHHLKNEMDPPLEALTKLAHSLSIVLNLDTKRQTFRSVAEVLTPLVKVSNTQETIFVQFCPMAFDNEGDSWLSVTKEILNPYFSEIMLNYGHIDKKIN